MLEPSQSIVQEEEITVDREQPEQYDSEITAFFPTSEELPISENTASPMPENTANAFCSKYGIGIAIICALIIIGGWIADSVHHNASNQKSIGQATNTTNTQQKPRLTPFLIIAGAISSLFIGGLICYKNRAKVSALLFCNRAKNNEPDNAIPLNEI